VETQDYYCIIQGTKRFDLLQRTVSGISAKVLSNELKDLGQNGFVKRKVNIEGFPVIVEHELTVCSLGLNDVVNSLSIAIETRLHEKMPYRITHSDCRCGSLSFRLPQYCKTLF
jgi:DNA-binding HxlR family transcriptional regulator